MWKKETETKEEKVMEYRRVEERDYEQCMCLIAEMAEESLSEYGTFLEEEHLKRAFDKLWPSSFVAVDGDKVVGVFAGHLVRDFCSPRHVYEEVLWFMNEKYRKYGVRLFKHVQQFCQDQGFDRMTMCCMHNSKTDKLFNFYGKLGFKPMETRFIKEI